MPPPLPWTKVHPAEPDREYVVLASYLPLRRRSATPRFLRMVLAIRRQLSAAEGLIGYSLYAKPFAGHYWTLSAWDDPAMLRRFVRGEPHVTVMGSLRDVMGPTRFVDWRSGQLPPDWSDALARLNTPPSPTDVE